MDAGGRMLSLAALAVLVCGCGSAHSTTTQPPAPTPPPAPPARTAPAKHAVAPAVAPAQARRYDKAFGTLPYHAGPLPVAQTIVSAREPDLLVARLAPARFFCLGSARRRLASVAGYYRRARAGVRARGLRDLRLVVAPLAPTAQVTVVWARAHGGRVALTAAGRAGRCSR